MTRDEYEELLKSDYWKGYSYSLIKERNFTCQDCGKNFHNERNKLQVHHLVYRDVNPWSYKPEELIVLCRDCHKIRHGYIVDYTPKENGEPTRVNAMPFKENAVPMQNNKSDRPNVPASHEKVPGINYILKAAIAVLVILIAFNLFKEFSGETAQPNSDVEPLEQNVVTEPKSAPKTNNSKSKPTVHQTKGQTQSSNTYAVSANVTSSTNTEESYSAQYEEADYSNSEATILELLEARNHEQVVKSAERAGVSTEGTTTEILERINNSRTGY